MTFTFVRCNNVMWVGASDAVLFDSVQDGKVQGLRPEVLTPLIHMYLNPPRYNITHIIYIFEGRVSYLYFLTQIAVLGRLLDTGLYTYVVDNPMVLMYLKILNNSSPRPRDHSLTPYLSSHKIVANFHEPYQRNKMHLNHRHMYANR